MRSIRFALPVLLVAYFFVSRPNADRKTGVEYIKSLPPMVMTTSLSDSLPVSAIQFLGLDEHLKGTKIIFGGGRYVKYFEYDADRTVVLTMLSHLPFSKYAQRSDVGAREINFAQLDVLRSSLKQEEFERAPAFWNADQSQFEIYESVKEPIMHTVLINKKTNRILHRMEYRG